MAIANRGQAALLYAVFVDLLGFGMLIPDIQLRAEKLVPAGMEKGILIGALLASTFVIQTVVSPRWGVVSDRRGRKPIFLVCQGLSVLSMVCYGLASSFLWLALSRLVAGLGAANVAVAQAAVADSSTEENRVAAMGRMSAAISSGLIAGPAVTGLLAHLGHLEMVGLIAAGMSASGLLAVALLTPFEAPKPQSQTAESKKGLAFRLLVDLPQLRPLVLIAVVAWFSLATLEGTFGRLLHDTLGMGQREFGILFSWESLLGVLVQAFALQWVVRKVRDTPLLRMAYISQGVGLALTPSASVLLTVMPPMITLMLASTLYAVGSSLANPTVNSLCSKLVPADRQGELFGILQGTRSIGFVLGPLLGGKLYDLNPWGPYLLAGGVCACAAVLVPKIESPEKP
ncbi:MAG: MFS transporter [Fimbriimonas sp.]